MKVQSIYNYSIKNYPYQSSAIKRDNVSFGHSGLWDQFKLGILKKSDIEMDELAKYFHMSSDAELKQVSTIRNFFGFKSDTRSEIAYQRLKKAVKSVLDTRGSLELLADLLKEKQQKQVLSQMENENLLNARTKIQELDNKFASRKEKFYHEENNLSQEDIDYFNRYNNDY